MKQYLEIKSEYPDAILFFRLGDFYEMFFEDAVTAAPIMEVALTSRDKKAESPIPLCGVPYHSANIYMAKLLDAGHKVAVCEQVEDPKAMGPQKNIVKREVVRVVTPGMRREEEGLAADQSCLIASLYIKEPGFALSWVDISSGAFWSASFSSFPQLENQLNKLAPGEILLPENHGHAALEAWQKVYRSLRPHCHFEKIPNWVYSNAATPFKDRFQLANLEGLGLNHPPTQVPCSQAILYYAENANKTRLDYLEPPRSFHAETTLHIDADSFQHLDIFPPPRGAYDFSLFRMLNHCQSSMGARKLKEWMLMPTRQHAILNERFEAIAVWQKQPLLQKSFREALGYIGDLQRRVTKLAFAGFGPRDLGQLRDALTYVPRLKELGAHLGGPFATWVSQLDAHEALAAELSRNLNDALPLHLKDGLVIKSGVCDELDRWRELTTGSLSKLAELESREREQTGIATLKVKFNKVFGYYIEVSKAQSTKVPSRYQRKQTLVNAERYITPELKDFEDQILHAQAYIWERESLLFDQLKGKALAATSSLLRLADKVAQLDVMANFGDLEKTLRLSRPVLLETDGALKIEGGRHLAVEASLDRGAFVANDLELNGDDQTFMLLFGPNMAGKSTYMRQVALIAYIAHLGCYVPAVRAEIPPLDAIFTRVGANDELAKGRSTFMVEMNETAYILRNASSRSLILLDELGRGTSTYDGLSLAWAITEYIHDVVGAKTIFATHYHELAQLESEKSRLRCYSVSAKTWDDHITFLHRVVPGPASKSYGLHVAGLAGVPSTVIQRAQAILATLEAPNQNAPRETSASQASASLTLNSTLTETAPNPMAEKLMTDLRAADLNALTPKQALDLLYEWKSRYN